MTLLELVEAACACIDDAAASKDADAFEALECALSDLRLATRTRRQAAGHRVCGDITTAERRECESDQYIERAAQRARDAA